MSLQLLPLVLGSAVIGNVVKRVLAVLGVGIVSFVGLELVLTQLESVVLSNLGAVGDIVCLLGVDTAAQLVLSAYSVRLAMIPLKALRVI